MKRNAAFKQFAKDCPKHFSEDVLTHGHLKEINPIQLTRKPKNVWKSPNKF